jgi:HEXXH motif-containing protein
VFWLLGGDHGPLLLDRGEIPLPADGTAYVDGDLAIGPLPRLLGVGPTMAPAPTGWAADYIPRTEHLHVASPAEFPVFCASMVEAAELLIDQWPHAWQHLTSELRWLLPLPDSGKPAHNYSVHAFRGLVVSSPRAPHALAQTLVHEGAHNRMSTIIDLFELCENAAETVWSPIVEAKRPLTAVFHGCFAFSQDIALTRLLLESPHGHPVASMERYLENRTSAVRSGLEVLRSTARLAPVGEAILDEITGLLGDG